MNRLFTTVVCAALAAGCAMETGEPAELGAASEAITGPGSGVSYTRGLVRLDLESGGRCSSVLVGPNLLVTAAHCVEDEVIDGSHLWNGMRWGFVRVRMVYKPSSTEVICLNEPCWNSPGSVRRSTVLAFWDATFGTNPASDMAILTRITQADFLAEPNMPGDPPVRDLDSGDFLRILNVSLPTNDQAYSMRVAGYGAPSDGSSTLVPRAGMMLVNDWNTNTMEAGFVAGPFGVSTCVGDSGGPIVYTPGIGTRSYVGGVTSGTFDAVVGSCPEVGDEIVFNRMSAKIWMLNHVRQWIEGQSCTEYSSSLLPGGGSYFKCW